MPLASLGSRNQAVSLPCASSYIFKTYLLPKITGIYIYNYTEMLVFLLLFSLTFVPAPQNTALLLYPSYYLDLHFFFLIQIFTA